ncbi:MAG: ribonuclease R [Sedimentisphaerales bacterium]|nr:ribonuclease R [Sedimentisphaerales bacterium]
MPQRYKKRIIKLISNANYQPLKQRALAQSLHIPDDEYRDFTQAIDQLQAEGRVVISKGQNITLPQMTNRVVGTFIANARGFGFVRPENATAQGDLFIPPGSTLDAVNGDTVVATTSRQGKRDGQTRFVGRIVEVLERETSRVVGKLIRQENHWFVQPDGNQMTSPVSVDDPSAKNAKLNDKVLVEILSYPSDQYYASGVIIEKLGKAGQSSAELKAIIRRFNLADKFSRAALKDTRAAIGRFQNTSLTKNREDIRDQTIITIDPKDAKDFDDAISLKRLPQGQWLLGVHIADVSYFVTPNSHLDQEAQHRGNSAYLPQHVVPMLPELLSNGLCSLQQDQDRFVKSAYITIDAKGRPTKTRFANSLIRSTQRLTYEDAEDILAGKTNNFPKPVVSLMRNMDTCAKLIQKRRLDQGMLTLEMPEAELVYDEKGHVIDAHPASNSFPHTIIEMFMLEANEAVARMLDSLNIPFLRRTHAAPDSLAVGETARIVNLCGYTLPKTFDRKALQQLLQRVQGKPESFVVNLAVLKSLQRAEYSPDHIGHFALASEHYCHFTSPIRRYPDLTIHRLLQAHITNSLDHYPDYGQLEDLGEHCSETERNAEEAERRLRQIKILQMLSKKLGSETKAVVTGITNFGLFAQLEKFLIDGLIRPEDIPAKLAAKKDKHKNKNRNRNRRTPNTPEKFTDTCPYKLGQEITVRIAAVNLADQTLDLVPVQ